MLRKQPGPTCKDFKTVETPPELVTTLNTSTQVPNPNETRIK